MQNTGTHGSFKRLRKAYPEQVDAGDPSDLNHQNDWEKDIWIILRLPKLQNTECK